MSDRTSEAGVIDGIKTLADSHLAELLEMHRGLVRTQIDSGTDGLTPHLIVMGMDCKHTIFAIATGFNTHQEKTAVMFQLGKRCFEDLVIPVLLSLSCEAWVSHQEVDEPRRYLCPGDDPQRREVAIIFTASLASPREASFASLALSRNETGIIHADGEWQLMDGATSLLLGSFFRGYFPYTKTKA